MVARFDPILRSFRFTLGFAFVLATFARAQLSRSILVAIDHGSYNNKAIPLSDLMRPERCMKSAKSLHKPACTTFWVTSALQPYKNVSVIVE
jgi:hypothetical protein